MATKKTPVRTTPIPYRQTERGTPEAIVKSLIIAFANQVDKIKGHDDQVSALFKAIEAVGGGREAVDWALEWSLVDAKIHAGDTKLAALQQVAKMCRMPTLRRRSNGELVDYNVRAQELLKAAVTSDKEGLAARWRDHRGLLIEAGFPAKIFAKLSELGREADQKRHQALLEGRRKKPSDSITTLGEAAEGAANSKRRTAKREPKKK
jgi:hypothetical protein